MSVKITAIAGVMLLASSSAWAQDVQRIEIVEHGIYTADKSSCNRDAQGIERCERSNIRHAATTWNVPAQLGVEFGLRYRVVGAPKGSKISVKRNWLIPEPGFRAPNASQPIRRLERSDDAVIGEATLVTYGFDDPWELVPGPWVIEFWYGNRKVGEQRFTIGKP
jgi:Domain of unknown function (DUF3859)